MSDDIHEVYAVRYAEHARMRSENYIFGDPHDEMTSISYYVWVIKGSYGTFVCDTGFDEVAAKERGRKIIHPVGEGLKAVGVQPDKVKHVIATHMHWDRVFPITYSVGDTLEGYKTIQKLASSRHHIVPGHDPEVMKLYPAAKAGLENWICRLDVEPKV
jgi:Metallo-beta-lactamase superfamily